MLHVRPAAAQRVTARTGWPGEAQRDCGPGATGMFDGIRARACERRRVGGERAWETFRASGGVPFRAGRASQRQRALDRLKTGAAATGRGQPFGAGGLVRPRSCGRGGDRWPA
jgi:hypothetical protein